MSNLVPAELGLEIDGTGGITPFDLIHTEYIQGIYKSDIKVENFVMSDEEVEEANRRAAEKFRSNKIQYQTIHLIHLIVFQKEEQQNKKLPKKHE